MGEKDIHLLFTLILKGRGEYYSLHRTNMGALHEQGGGTVDTFAHSKSCIAYQDESRRPGMRGKSATMCLG
jgi:hypothetical protein